MKLLLLLVGLGLPGAAKAQGLAPRKVLPINLVDLVDMLRNALNPRFKVLNKPTPVYRQPTDTLGGRCVFKLAPGTRVYSKKAFPQGYMIALDFGGTEVYYLPYKLVAGLPTQVEI